MIFKVIPQQYRHFPIILENVPVADYRLDTLTNEFAQTFSVRNTFRFSSYSFDTNVAVAKIGLFVNSSAYSNGDKTTYFKNTFSFL